MKNLTVIAAVLMAGCALRAPVLAQSNALHLCDQQSTSHCVTWKMPATIAADLVVQGVTPVAQGFIVTGSAVNDAYLLIDGLHASYDSGSGAGLFYATKSSSLSPWQITGSNIILFANSGPGTASLNLSPVSGIGATGHLFPTGAYDLGTSSSKWRDGYFVGTILGGSGSLSASAAQFANNASAGTITAANAGSGSAGIFLNNSGSEAAVTLVNSGVGYGVSDGSAAGSAFAKITDLGITGSTQCIQANAAGVLSGSGAPCAGSTYLPLAGGTMTGDILATGTVNIGSSGTHINFGWFYQTLNDYVSFLDGGVNKMTMGFDGSHNVCLTNNLSITGWCWDASGGAQPRSSIVPNTSNAYDLGTTSLRFKAGWFAGAATANSLVSATSITGGNAAYAGNTGTFQNSSASLATVTVQNASTYYGLADISTGGSYLAKATIGNITGSTQCLQANTSGVISGAGFACPNGALYLPLAGGSMTGDITSHSLTPLTDNTYDLGFDNFSGTSLRYKRAYFSGQVRLESSGVVLMTISGNTPSSAQFVVVNGDSSGLGIWDVSAGGSMFTKVIVSSMPTSCSGQVTGTLRNNSGVVNICP